MRTNAKRIKFVHRKDRLTDLHDDILIQILSFLDVKSAAQTCVLSKRWNNKLWMHHPDVYLNSKTFGRTSYRFRKFVNMVLTQRDKLHVQSRSFSFTDVNHHVLHLYLSSCTALKTLWLEKIRFTGGVDIFSSLVELTELHIIGCHIIGKDECFPVGAPRLERLTILQNKSGLHWKISSGVLKYLRTDLWFSGSTINHLPHCIEELEIDFPALTKYKKFHFAKRLIKIFRYLPQAESLTLPKSVLQVISAFPKNFESRVRVTLPQFKWKVLKVKTKHDLPTEYFPEYRPGLAVLMKNCSKTLKVEFV